MVRSQCVDERCRVGTLPFFCAACLLLSFAVSVDAGDIHNYFWDGGADTDNWGDGFNWELFRVPSNDGLADVIFKGPGGISDIADLDNNIVDWAVDKLIFGEEATGSYTLIGGMLTVGLISNDDVNEHDFSNTRVNVDGLFLTISADSGDIDFNTNVNFFVPNGSINVNTGGAGGGHSVFFDGGITGAGSITTGRLTIDDGTRVRIGASSTVLDRIDVIDGTLQLNVSSPLSTSADVGLSAPGTFDLNGFNENIGQLFGSGSVLTGGATLTVGDTIDFIFSGVISESGGITKDGTGWFYLSGANTYTGATNVTAGTLLLATGGSLSNDTDVSVSSGATFDLNGISDTVDSISGAGTILLGGATLIVDETSGSRTFSGAIQESGELQKDGAGTLVLGGSNTFTLLDINAGTVSVSSQGNLGSGTIELGAQLLITGSFTNAREITMTSGGSINVNSGVTLTQTANISGSSNLTKNGSGTLSLNANNSYSGDTKINAGVLQLGAADRISNSSHVMVAAGATFDLNNFAETVQTLSGAGIVDTGGTSGVLTANAASGNFFFGGTISGAGGFNKQGGHFLQLTGVNANSGATNITGGTLQLSGSGSLGNNSDVSATGATWDLNGVNDTVDSVSGSGSILLGGATLTVDELGATTRTFSGSLSEAGALVKSGTHTMVLSGTNSYTGTTTLDGGVLRVTNSGNLGAGGLIFDTGTLNTTASFTNSRTVQINANDSATFDVNGSTTLTQTGVITGAATTTLVKEGDGTLTLQANNAATFTGAVDVNAGTLEFGAGDVLSDATSLDLASGTILLVTQGEGIGGLTGNGIAQLVDGEGIDVGANNLNATYNGVISGVGTFTKRGTGVQTIGGAWTYNGVTFLAAGTLQLSGTTAGLPDATDVHMSAGAVFDLNGQSDTIDSLNGLGGSVLLGGATLTIGNNNGAGAFPGTITESGNLVKVGSGLQELSGVNSYAGTTDFNAGVVQIAANNNLGASDLRFNGGTLATTGTITSTRAMILNPVGGTLDVAAGQVFRQQNIISGAGGLTKAGSGEIEIAFNNTYGGATSIAAGTMQLVSAGSLPNTSNVSVAQAAVWDLNGISDTVGSLSGSGNTLLNGATLTVAGSSGAIDYSGVISGPGSIVKTGNHSWNLAGTNNTHTGSTAINGGTLSINSNSNLGASSATLSFNGGTLAINGDITLPRATMLNAGGGSISLAALANPTISGDISGSGSLFITGAAGSFLTLTGANSYTGNTTVSNTTLRVASNANLGANPSDLLLQNSLLAVMGSFTNQHEIVLEGGGSFSVFPGVTLTQSVGISGNGTLGKIGAGTLLLTAPATHAGNTVISTGVLQFGSGALPDAFDVTVSTGGTWDLNGVSDSIDGLFGGGAVLLGGGTLTLGSASGNGSFSGAIQEAGAVIKTGTGEQILSGANSYIGGTTINSGVLQIANNASLGDASAALVFNLGTLRTTTSFSMGRTTTANTIGVFDVASATTLTLTSPIGGAGGIGKIGAGTLELAQANTYAGATDVESGTLRLSGSGRLPDSTDLNVRTGATYDLTDISDAIDSLTGSGNVLLGAGTITIGTAGGNGSFSGVIIGAGNLWKEGAGVQTLSGQNTYNGATVVNGGTLILTGGGSIDQTALSIGFDNGSDGTVTAEGAGTTWDVSGALLVGVNGTGRVNINSSATISVGSQVTIGTSTGVGSVVLDGGTLNNSTGSGVVIVAGMLGGSGTVVGNVTNHDTLAPGTSPGILNIEGNYVQETTGTLVAEIGGTANGQYDRLALTGTASLSGALDLNLIGFTPVSSQTFEILTAASLVGNFANAANGVRLDVTSGGTGSFQVNYGPGSLFNPNHVVLSDFVAMTTDLLGDYNSNGTVDASDYVVWRKTFGLVGSGLAADGNGNGEIDFADYNVWRARFGQTLSGGGSSSAAKFVAVPEPSCFYLVIAAVALFQQSFTGRRYSK